MAQEASQEAKACEGSGASIVVTTGGIHDILAENCTLQDTDNGLRIKSGRDGGGKVRRILYRNMTMQNVSPAKVADN